MCVPDRVVTNVDLEKLMDTNDEWIRQRTGIVERRYVSEGETPATLAERASRRALESAGLEPGDVDCIVLATLSGEADFPGTSFFLQAALGLDDTPCFDLRAQCTGFLYALSVARSFVRAEQFRRVLVVGCEVHSTGLDFSTEGRDVTVIFGDGAGAVLVEPNTESEDPGEILSICLHAQGRYARKLWTEAPGSAIYPQRLTPELLAERRHYPVMEGRFVFKHAVTRMPEVLREGLETAGIKLEEGAQQHPEVRQLLRGLDPDAAGRARAGRPASPGRDRGAHRIRIRLQLGERGSTLVEAGSRRRVLRIGLCGP
jgi:3-oxoacyl-[acyl-carrier-protein] synthase-3